MSSGTSTRAAEHADDAENSLKSVLRLRGHATGGLHVAQFFIVLALIAATAAVVMARQSAPENLVLISVTIGAAAAVAFALYRVVLPLTAPDGIESEPLHDRLRADLEREKMLTLRSIKELEFDRAMGKVSAQDFDEMAARLRARAIGLMKQLDAGGSAYETLIERDVRARIGKAARRGDMESPAATPDRHDCACGVRNDPDARFCKACGSRLEAA